ncbi:amino acid kinase family protein, partial [Enterococcus faecium]|uniref:amino acid kinase family protein n=1 Tax=Enterococcus faecium TaxID=1352 RepID=UPI00292DA525
GGSDITGAILAKMLQAESYENWTDVSGIMMADPRIIDHPKIILAPAMDLLREGTCVLEAWIPFEKEISIMVAGNGQGDFTTFPVV